MFMGRVGFSGSSRLPSEGLRRVQCLGVSWTMGRPGFYLQNRKAVLQDYLVMICVISTCRENRQELLQKTAVRARDFAVIIPSLLWARGNGPQVGSKLLQYPVNKGRQVA